MPGSTMPRILQSLLVLSALGLAACPVPYPRTEAASSPVVGRVLAADGSPLRGAEVAVSTEWSDRPCARTVVSSRTDATGSFALPGSQRHYKMMWFIPNLDVGRPSFRLCVAFGDTLRPAYQGYGSLAETAPTDTVSCVAWEWDAVPRVSCNGYSRQAVVTGGQWKAPSGRDGFFRLFLVDQDRPLAFAQWVEPLEAADRSDTTRRYQVRDTVRLPFDRDKVWAITGMQLWRREGRWVASLEGLKHAFMNDMSRAELVYGLGPPGQVTHLAGP